jgi:uncharacterized membrane protein YciS (DUF1049 family)
MQRFLNQLVPFVLIGIAIVAFAFGIMLLAYLFLFGAIIGFILFTIAWIRHHFFTTKTPAKAKNKSGRIIDSDDWKKM